LKIPDVALMSFEGLMAKKFRFALNLVGILIGVAAITGLIALTQGLNNEISGQLGGLGGNTITVVAGAGFGPHSGSGPMEQKAVTVSLDWREIDIIEKLPGVDLIAPTISGGGAWFSLKGDIYTVSITGITETYFLINEGTEIESGRTIKRSDNAVAVIGYSISVPDPNNKPLVEIGDRITIQAEVKGEIKKLTVRVIGVLEETGGTFGGDTNFFIPLKTCEQFFETEGVYDSIQVLAEDSDIVEPLAALIESKIDGVTAITAAGAMETINTVIGTLEAVLGGIAAISLLVAGVGIINTMIVSVMERTKEIGTLKAIGAKSVDILVMFIFEAALTGVVGGVIGAILGFILGVVIGSYVGVGVVPTVELGLIAVLFAVTTSVISGLYPAWNASKLNPVEALRHE